MKKMILRICFKPLTLLNKLIKKDERIIFFYSNLGFRDNVKAFYDYLIEREYHRNYKIIVSINDYEKYKENAPANIKFISNSRGIASFLKAKYAFYCFGKYPIKPSKKQIVVNLWHGMPLKRIGNMEEGLEKIDYNYFTYIVATSELFRPILMKSFHCKSSQVIIMGQPRNDELFQKNAILDKSVRRGADKVIVWLPTYRNEKKSFPVPIVNQEQSQELNRILKDRNMRLIIKIHPLQIIEGEIKKYSNIEFITQSELDKAKLSVYAILRAADALITDYSSVYFDYMMLNRPIAFTVDDIEKYQKERGFVFDNPLEYMPGIKISNFAHLLELIEDISKDKDKYQKERQNLNIIINQYSDGKSCDRVADYVFGR